MYKRQLRDCVQELIDLQMDAAVSDSTITQKQAELNSLYDSFSEKYGLINDRANRLAYADDSSYYQMCIRDRLTEPLELAEDGRLMLTEEEGLNFTGGFSTLSQFLQEQKKDRHTG